MTPEAPTLTKEQIEAGRDFLMGLENGEGEPLDEMINKLCNMALASLDRPTLAQAQQSLELRRALERILNLAEGTTPGEWKRIKGETDDGGEGYAWLNETGHDLFMCGDTNKKANILFINKIRRELPKITQALTLPLSAAELRVKAMEDVLEGFKPMQEALANKDVSLAAWKIIQSYRAWVDKALAALPEGEVKL